MLIFENVECSNRLVAASHGGKEQGKQTMVDSDLSDIASYAKIDLSIVDDTNNQRQSISNPTL